MALSSQTITGIAAQQVYTLTLKFISADYLTVLVDGSPAAFTVSADQTQLTITTPAIAGGETILVSRLTPGTEAGRLVKFSDLAFARQEDLELASRQLLHLIQEANDIMVAIQCLSQGAGGHWDAESLKIQNLAAGVAATDAVNKAQLDALSIAAGNLPVVSAGDNDSGLAVVAGAWAVRTPPQMRTHLGLGTAAVENAGTAANQLLKLNGSAQYPGLDGQLINLTSHSLTTLVNQRYRAVVLEAAESDLFQPFQSASATWYESASSRVAIPDIVELDPVSEVAYNAGLKQIELSAGTWEVSYSLRVENTEGANLERTLGLRITDDDDSATQVAFDTEYDDIGLESLAPADGSVFLANTILLQSASAVNICLRMVEKDASNDLDVHFVRVVVRKVSDSI